MTLIGKILRFTEYWNHNHVRDDEMTQEMTTQMKRASEDAFIAGMEYNRDPQNNPDFEPFWEANLISDKT